MLTFTQAGDESDSGEGKLGGPNGLASRGPPSALNGAGVVLGGVGGAGAGVNNRQITRTSDDSLGTLNGRALYGPQRPPEMMQYGNKGDAWNFDGLNEQEQGAETALMSTMDVEEDDAASTTAVMDNAGGFIDPRMEEDFDTAGQNTPADSDHEWHDDHTLYSAAHEHHEEADMGSLHLEDAGMIGGEMEGVGDSPVAEIYPPAAPYYSDHEKLD